MAQSPRRSRKAAVPTPSRVGGRRPYFDPLIDGAVCGPTPQGGFSWPVGPIHLLWTSAPTWCNTSFVGRGILDAPTRPPSGAVRDAGPYAGGGRQCSTAEPIGPWKMAAAYRRRHTQVPHYGRWGVSLAAASGSFAPCEARPEALPLETAIWATRRRLARGVGEEFCVRARPSFVAILDVWQEAEPQLWRKRPGDARRHTGGKLPYRKNRVKLLTFCT